MPELRVAGSVANFVLLACRDCVITASQWSLLPEGTLWHPFTSLAASEHLLLDVLKSFATLLLRN